MSSFCWPSRRVNVVGTVPLAVTSRMKLPCCGLDSTPLACTLVTSDRLNCALKNDVALADTCDGSMPAASRDSISAVASSAACIAVRAALPRL
jgi:hypothetical protein